MQVSTTNDVKVYNISTGKSLPEWITERKRRKLLKEDEDLRRSIELIQDFEMPTAATSITMTTDGQYILAAGTYKPRIRCYDTIQLSMKFERCLNSEVVAMEILSDDYSKLVMLQNDRNLEFHVQHGTYYRTRIPVFGRDMSYHYPSCDLYIASASSEIYRLNLEQGRYLSPLATQSKGSNVSVICDEHQLLAMGTEDGVVECFDPRSSTSIGILDVTSEDQGCSVTALNFRDALTLGVGTSTGQVLMYDIRSPRPLLTKDHHYQLPIVSLHFNKQQNFTLSADKRVLRIWDTLTGSPFTSIEPEHDINAVCPVADTGLVFFAVEDSKMQSYYIPSVGPAPKWCSFLDNLTEELEETPQTDTVYDNYKFVTADDLNNLGLTHLVGTNMLRAYMHGYFMDIKLYHKAKSVSEPFAYEEYRRKKIKERIQQKSVNRAKAKILPKVNKQLAKKLQEMKKADSSVPTNPLHDDRFSALFANPDFEIDENSEDFMKRNPALLKHLQKATPTNNETIQSDNESNSDEDRDEEVGVVSDNIPSSVTLHEGEYRHSTSLSLSRVSMKERMEMMSSEDEEGVDNIEEKHHGNKELTFHLKKRQSKKLVDHRGGKKDLTHRNERKNVRRSAASILPKKKGPVYWKGKRVK